MSQKYNMKKLFMIAKVISCIVIIDTYMIYQLYNIITIVISPNTNYWF
jgi:hypothetical protein